ncbi:DUF309 domain-containing protein [Halobacteriovorax sp.]|uniref:DUF309 domain-containing protein n=1 Tax=Halobacteriovorax sp. TaxID=2020862 RepID=UPI0035680AFC
MHRYAPKRSFPSYAFTPGKNKHPNKEGGHSFGLDEITSDKLSLSNTDYLFAIDLINYEYYWEAHVYLEAIWNAHNRKGPEADFCKGLIKMSAGALKYRLNSIPSFEGHLDRAIELFESLVGTEIDSGVQPGSLILICEKWKNEEFVQIEI